MSVEEEYKKLLECFVKLNQCQNISTLIYDPNALREMNWMATNHKNNNSSSGEQAASDGTLDSFANYYVNLTQPTSHSSNHYHAAANTTLITTMNTTTNTANMSRLGSERVVVMDASYTMKMAIRVSYAVQQLDHLASDQQQLVLTPRQALDKVIGVLQEIFFDTLPSSMKGNHDAESKRAFFGLYTSSRRVPVSAAVESLFVITYVSVKLRLELLFGLLEKRLREEVEAQLGKYSANGDDASDLTLMSLNSTRTLLEDLRETYNNILLLVPSLCGERQLCEHLLHLQQAGTSANPTSHGSQTSEVAPQEGSSTLAEMSPIYDSILRYYYQLTDWVLLVLSSNEISEENVSYAKVLRVDCNGRTGVLEVTLRRPQFTHSNSQWGLLFNEKGRLIDIDVNLRLHDKGEALHQLLNCSREGALLLSANGTNIVPKSARSKKVPDVQDIMTKFGEASKNKKTLKLQLRSDGFKDKQRLISFQLAFLVFPQGGEGAAGQRASFWLHRRDVRASWRMNFTTEEQPIQPLSTEAEPQNGVSPSSTSKDAQTIVKFVPSKATVSHMSAQAQSFLLQYQDRLQVLQVNGITIETEAQLLQLLSDRECARVDIVVTPSQSALKKLYATAEKNANSPEYNYDENFMPKDSLSADLSAMQKGRLKAANKRALAAAVSEGEEAGVVHSRRRSRKDSGDSTTDKRSKRKSGTNRSSADLIDQMVAAVMRGTEVDGEHYEKDMKRALADPQDPELLASNPEIEEEDLQAYVAPDAAVIAVLEDMYPGKGEALISSGEAAGELLMGGTAAAKRSPRNRNSNTAKRNNTTAEELEKENKEEGVSEQQAENEFSALQEEIEDMASVTHTVKFDNGVKLFLPFPKEAHTVQFDRSSVSEPWSLNLKVGKHRERDNTPYLQLVGLPPLGVEKGKGNSQTLPKAYYTRAKQQNAFLAQFYKNDKQWYIEQVNGKAVDQRLKETVAAITKAKRITLKFLTHLR